MTRQRSRALWGTAAVILLAVFLPAGVNQYWMQIGTLAFVYWVLIAGLDLIIGYAGQLAIGFVGLLAIGAYTASILCEKAGWPAFAALAGPGPRAPSSDSWWGCRPSA